MGVDHNGHGLKRMISAFATSCIMLLAICVTSDREEGKNRKAETHIHSDSGDGERLNLRPRLWLVSPKLHLLLIPLVSVQLKTPTRVPITDQHRGRALRHDARHVEAADQQSLTQRRQRCGLRE